jgi:hypothetical protein
VHISSTVKHLVLPTWIRKRRIRPTSVTDLDASAVCHEVKKRCRVAYMETLRWIKDGPSSRFGRPLSRHNCTKCKNHDSNATHHALCQNVLRKFKSTGEKDLRDVLIQYLTNCQTRHPLWKVDRPTDHGQKSLFEISSSRATCSIFNTQQPGDGGGSALSRC